MNDLSGYPSHYQLHLIDLLNKLLEIWLTSFDFATLSNLARKLLCIYFWTPVIITLTTAYQHFYCNTYKTRIINFLIPAKNDLHPRSLFILKTPTATTNYRKNVLRKLFNQSLLIVVLLKCFVTVYRISKFPRDPYRDKNPLDSWPSRLK